MPRFYQIFETGLSAQSHKQHGRHASAISGYTLAEQKVSKQQLIKVSAYQSMLYSIFDTKSIDLNRDLNQWLKLHWFKSANPVHNPVHLLTYVQLSSIINK